MNLSDHSLDFNANTDLAERKSKGQYMTPPAVSEVLLNRVPIRPGDTVLDPAVGTGELLYAAHAKQPEATYEGWDIDDHVRSFIPDDAPFAHETRDGLWSTDRDGTYDVVLANPPYFEMKIGSDEKAAFAEVVGGGRTNIFTLFFHRALDLLKDGGVAGFIVPPSMNNGAYFAKLRAHLLKHATIESIDILDDSSLFVDAQTGVQIIVFRKTSTPVLNTSVVFRSPGAKGETVIFTRDATAMYQAWEDSSSLWNLGYKAVTGNVVWNQHKEEFVPEGSGAIPLIYAKDIGSDGTISFLPSLDNRRWLPEGHKPYISEGLVVNRIVGALGKQKIRVAKPQGVFFGENHVNVIVPRSDVQQTATLDEVMGALQAVPARYLNLLTGNTQISATELTHHIPLSV